MNTELNNEDFRKYAEERTKLPGEIIETLPDGTIIRQAKQEAKAGFALITGDELMKKEFPALKSPVSNLIVEGLTLLCGSSKIGKSWFALSLCCAVASGKPFLGRRTEQGAVLYLALEDSYRRLQERLIKLNEIPNENLSLSTECAHIDTGLMLQLQQWAGERENPQLIVIDTLQKIRSATPARANAYGVDYGDMSKLKKFADENHIALVLVHHLNKMKDVNDPYDRISGSTGLMGAADTTIMIARERGSDDATLTYTGRDVWDDDIHLRMCNGRWNAVGADVCAYEDYESDPIVRMCRSLLKMAFGTNRKTVKIATQDFIDDGVKLTGKFIASGSTDLYNKLERLQSQLWQYDRITIAFNKRIGSARGFHLIQTLNDDAENIIEGEDKYG